MLAHDFLKKDDRGFTPISSSRSAWYFGVLVLVKLLRSVGIFIIDILAKQIHVVGLLWLLKLVAAAIVVPLQKPLTQGKSLRKSLHMRIGQLALVNCLIETIWFYGITFCGPLRSVLVFEQSPAVVLVAVMTLLKGGGSPSKTRGVIALGVGAIALVLMDRDASVETDHYKSHSHQSVLNHIFYHLIHWSGVSDHRGGVLLLMAAVFIKMAYDSSFRHLAVEIGGPKRLYALMTLVSSIILTPPAVLILMNGQSRIQSYFEFILLLIMAASFIMVLDFYTESVCFQHVADPVMASARWSPVIMFSCAFTIASVWYSQDHHTPGAHALSGGVLVTLICFSIASFALTSSSTPRSRGGHYVGLSDSGVPLYTYGEAFLQKTSRSMMLFVKETLAEILSSSDSRRIFWFLCANLSFCGVEFLYGFWTNSLGLISDGFHMLFDCSALVMGLVAAVMSRWPASRYYSYGYGRVEVLSGFINALFLIVIAFFILLEALERLYDPPDVSTDKLMVVAVAGLIVNVFGMYAFHGADHGHSHGGGGHGHSHGGGGHGHSHGGSASHGHSHGGNANMQGVFLHVLADTLGSVFVIISTLLIQYFEWKWVDPLCSLILSMLILLSVYPLLMASMATLMQCIPPELEHEYDHVLCQILQLDGVLSYSRSHFWQLKSDLNVASLHVQVRDDVNDQIIRQKILQMLKEGGATQAAVQIEKDGFFHLIQSMCPSYRLPYRVTKGLSVGYNQGNCHDANDTHHGHSHGEGGHGHDHGHSHSPSESDHYRQCDGHSPNEQCSHSHAAPNGYVGSSYTA
uniref:Proton-coupled zinc antiporter SLC30A5 n=1 Tax=Parascaris univalens TaxID=6257 RepID=A0A915AVW8_PARUN